MGCCLGESFLAKGDLGHRTKAVAACDTAIDIAAAHRYRHVEATARAVRADALAALGDPGAGRAQRPR